MKNITIPCSVCVGKKLCSPKQNLSFFFVCVCVNVLTDISRFLSIFHVILCECCYKRVLIDRTNRKVYWGLIFIVKIFCPWLYKPKPDEFFSKINIIIFLLTVASALSNQFSVLHCPFFVNTVTDFQVFLYPF